MGVPDGSADEGPEKRQPLGMRRKLYPVVGLEVTDDGFDGGTPSQVVPDVGGDGLRLHRRIDDQTGKIGRLRRPGTRRHVAEVLEIRALQTPCAQHLVRQVVQDIAQVAFAWVLKVGEDVVPIPGTKRHRYLEDNLQAAMLRLSTEEIERLDGALGADGVSGARYNDHDLSMLNR